MKINIEKPSAVPKSIRNITTPDEKAHLRQEKKLPGRVKAVVYAGNHRGPAATIQFNRDIQLYNLWEALLYVEWYETQGFYTPGTAAKAVAAWRGEEEK